MNIKELKTFCENTPLVVHNSQFENKWLLSRGIDGKIVDDTLLLAYLIDERMPLDLQSLCLKFNIDAPFKEEFGKDVTLITGDRLVKRNCKDAQNTLKLRDILKPMLSPKELRVYEKVLLPGTKTMARIENTGVYFKGVDELLAEIDDKIDELNLDDEDILKSFEENIEGKFNINSYPQREILVYDFMGYKQLPFKQAKTKAGNPSTKIDVLRRLQERNPSDFLDKFIKYSSLVGWKEKYEEIGKFCEDCGHRHTIDNFLYCNLRMGITTTGRIASSHPNMQNMPSRAGIWTRKIFKSRYPNGVILEADYDQIELRILAGLSGDEKLLEDFALGKDPHSEMARTAFNLVGIVSKEDRDKGKTLNFAIPFGAGVSRVAFETNRTIPEAKIWLDRYWAEHKTLKKWLEGIPESGIVYSPTGMKRHITTWTQGRNFPIQNSAFVVLMLALNKLVDKTKGYVVDLCIHDSIRMDIENKEDAPKIIEEVRDIIEFAPKEVFPWLPIPLTVGFKIGENWGNMQDA